MFGSRRVAPFPVFLRRMAISLGLSGALIFAALFVGVAGYHWIAGLAWIDALLNASMILGGMGPVDALPHDPAKLFASFYALFSGLIFVGAVGLVISPIVHRMLHQFHIDDDDLRAGE